MTARQQPVRISFDPLATETAGVVCGSAQSGKAKQHIRLNIENNSPLVFTDVWKVRLTAAIYVATFTV